MIRHTRSAGFTLIELMVTLAIIAILAGVGWPLFQGYIAKGHRADAVILLTKTQGYLESCYSKIRDYNTCSASFPADITTPPAPNNHFAISFSGDASTYTITATATTAQAANDSACQVFQISNTGDKAGTTNTYCWPSN